MSATPSAFVSVGTQTRASEGVRSWLSTPAGKWTALGVGAAAAATAAYALYQRAQQTASHIPASRPLHWVLKVGDLRASVDFYVGVLGMIVIRHEEFDQGCEATCNGPYSGWWSKTMLAFPDTREEAFAIELTYNYGVSSYELGNDLIGLHVRLSGAADRARKLGLSVESTSEQGVTRVQTPEGPWFYLHEDAPLAVTNPATDPFLYASLSSSDLDVSAAFWRRVMGMRSYTSGAATASSPKAGVAAGCRWAVLGYTSHQAKVLLSELPVGEKVSHAASYGRYAFGVGDCLAVYARAQAAGATVLHAPVTLDTPGKARVQVCILADADGNEVAAVDDSDFRALCVTKPGDEIIKWEWREKAIAKQIKFQKAFNKDSDAPTHASARK